GVRFPRARPQPPHSQKPLVVGSSDTCCSRRSRRLTLQPFRLDSFCLTFGFSFNKPYYEIDSLNYSISSISSFVKSNCSIKCCFTMSCLSSAKSYNTCKFSSHVSTDSMLSHL